MYLGLLAACRTLILLLACLAQCTVKAFAFSYCIMLSPYGCRILEACTLKQKNEDMKGVDFSERGGTRELGGVRER